MSRLGRTLVIGTLLLGAAGVAGRYTFLAAKPDAGLYAYDTAQVSRGEIKRVVSTTGTVRPRTTVQVGSELSGRIKSIAVDFNAKVEAGDLLAVIEPKTFESKAKQAKADVLSAEAALMSAEAALRKATSIVQNAERAFGRQKLLDQKGIAAGAAVDNAERDLSVARAEADAAQANLTNARALVAQKTAQLDQATIDLERTQIRAPIGGIVLHRAVDVGQTVAASFQAPELFRLAGDLASVHIEAQVGEADIGSVRRDQQVIFEVDAHPKRKFNGRVEQIRLSPSATESVVTYTVIIEADNASLDLFPGMTANVRIETARLDDVVRLPADAVRFKPPKDVRVAGEAKTAGAGAKDEATETLEAKIQRWTRRLKLDERQVQALKDQMATPAEPGDRPAPSIEAVLAGLLSPEQGARFAAIKAERDATQRAAVWVLARDGTPEKRAVRVGMADLQFVELAGKELKPGDEVIVRSRKAKTP